MEIKKVHEAPWYEMYPMFILIVIAAFFGIFPHYLMDTITVDSFDILDFILLFVEFTQWSRARRHVNSQYRGKIKSIFYVCIIFHETPISTYCSLKIKIYQENIFK